MTSLVLNNSVLNASLKGVKVSQFLLYELHYAKNLTVNVLKFQTPNLVSDKMAPANSADLIELRFYSPVNPLGPC